MDRIKKQRNLIMSWQRIFSMNMNLVLTFFSNQNQNPSKCQNTKQKATQVSLNSNPNLLCNIKKEPLKVLFAFKTALPLISYRTNINKFIHAIPPNQQTSFIRPKTKIKHWINSVQEAGKKSGGNANRDMSGKRWFQFELDSNPIVQCVKLKKEANLSFFFTIH